MVPGLGTSGLTEATIRPIVPPGPGGAKHALADLERQVPDGDQILVGLGRQSDHVVELQVLDTGPKDQVGLVENLLVGHGLVDDPTETIGPSLGRDRNRPLTALAEQGHDGLRQVVKPAAMPGEMPYPMSTSAFEDELDVGVVAQRDRHQADAVGVRPGRPGDLENAFSREGPDRQVVVAGPAEPAQVRAARGRLRSAVAIRTRCRA